MTDLNYNTFYHYLRNNHRRQYEHAILQRWTVCIPEMKSLSGIQFSKDFINTHLLRKSPYYPRHYFSNTEPELQYKCIENKLYLLDNENNYTISIISVETGCNSEYHNFDIFIVDKPLHPKFEPEKCLLDIRQKTVSSYEEAVEFFNNFIEHKEIIQNVENDITNIKKFRDSENATCVIREIITSKWMSFLQQFSIEWQRDAYFQHLLSLSLEILIMQKLSNKVFPLICLRFQNEDENLLKKCKKLSKLKISADQFGAPEDYAIPLPAAIVELASLDSQETPIKKLTCLHTTYDLILAELKAAIVDTLSDAVDSTIPKIHECAIVPLIMTVIIKVKPIHMPSNLYFMEHFQWTLTPNDKLWISLNAFKLALSQLFTINVEDLLPRSKKIHLELGLEDLMNINGEVNERFDRNGKRLNIPLSPLDRHLERVTEMIAASTEKSNCF